MYTCLFCFYFWGLLGVFNVTLKFALWKFLAYFENLSHGNGRMYLFA